jgi:ABC-2 type transport system ATP-binding protein
VGKRFGSFEALRGLSLAVEEGEVFGLLGPNGAGKTTAIRILAGLEAATRGEARVFGLRVPNADARAWLGYMPQETALYRDLTVRQNLDLFGALQGLGPAERAERIRDLLAWVQLAGWADAPVRDLSGGMQHRTSLAAALLHEPRLLILDEPTVGVDPELRASFWEQFHAMAEEGTTILLTTHYMDEAQHLADRVAVIAAGQIVAEGTPDTLAGRDMAKTRVRFRLPDGVSPPADVLAEQTTSGGFTEFATEDPIGVLHRLFGWASDNGVELDGLEVTRPSLEDVYLQLTGGAAREEPEPVGRGRRMQR